MKMIQKRWVGIALLASVAILVIVTTLNLLALFAVINESPPPAAYMQTIAYALCGISLVTCLSYFGFRGEKRIVAASVNGNGAVQEC